MRDVRRKSQEDGDSEDRVVVEVDELPNFLKEQCAGDGVGSTVKKEMFNSVREITVRTGSNLIGTKVFVCTEFIES